VLPKVLDPLGVVVLSGRVEVPPDDEVVAGLSVVVLPEELKPARRGSLRFVEDPSTPVTLLGMAWCREELKSVVRCA